MAEINDLVKTLQSKFQQPESTPPIGLEAYVPQAETGGFFKDLAGAAIAEVRSGVADLPRVLNKTSEAFSNIAAQKGITFTRTDIFARLADAIEPQDFQNPDTLAAKLGQVFGGLLVGLPKYGLPLLATGGGALAAIPVMGGIEAATAWGRNAPPSDIAKAGLAGGATGALFGGAGQLSRLPRAAALGTGAMGIQAVAGETRPEELAISGLTMAGLGMLGSRLPHNLANQLHKLGYSDEAIKTLSSIKRAREIVRNKEKYSPPEPVAPATTPGQLNLPLQEKINVEVPSETTTNQLNLPLRIKNTIDPETLIYNKILVARGFTDKDIAAMPIETKIAISNDPAHNAKTIKIDPVTGTMTLTEVPKVATQEAIVDKGGATVEDLAADPVKTAAIVEHLKTKLPVETGRVDVEKLMRPFQGVTTDEIKTKFVEAGLPIGSLTRDEMIAILEKKMAIKSVIKAATPEKIEEIDKKIAISTAKASALEKKIAQPIIDTKVPLNKELVSQLRFKFQIGVADAKKSAKILQERGITVPTQATTFFDTINLPLLPKGKSLATHILDAEAKSKRIEPAPVEKVSASAKFEEAKNLWLEYNKEKDTTKRRELKTRITTLIGDKSLTAKDVEIYLTSGKRGLTPTDIEAKLAWVKSELEKIGPEEPGIEVKAPIVTEVTTPIKGKKKTTVKKLQEEMVKPEETNVTSPEHAALVDKAAKLWPKREIDLAGLSDDDLIKIVAKDIKPTQATITPTGKLHVFTNEDKVLAKILGTSIEEAAPIKESVKPTNPGVTDAEFRAASKWMEIDPLMENKLTPADKQQMVDAHRKYLAEHIDEISKTGGLLEKGEVKANQTFNNTISQDPTTDAEVIKLTARLAKVDRKIEEIKPLVAIGNVDRLDLNTLQNERNKVIKSIAQRRHDIANEKKRASNRIGGEEKLITLSKDDSGGIIIKTKVSDNIDKFKFITTQDGKVPLPGDTSLKTVAEVTVDKSSGNSIRSTLPDTLDIPQSEFFKEQISKTIQTHYENQGKGISEVGKLRTGIDVDLLKDMSQRLKNKTIAIYQNFVARRGVNKSIAKTELPSVMKDIMDSDSLRLKEREIAAMHTEQMEQELSRAPRTTVISDVDKQIKTQEAVMQMAAKTDPNIAIQIAKGEIPMVKPTDIMGQSMANANPDIVKVSEITVKNELLKRYLKEQLVYGENSRLNKIFAKINADPNAKLLREQIGNEFIAETKGYSASRVSPSTHPLIIEAKEEIRKFLDAFGDTNNLRERGFFINKYFPLIADMGETYKKIKGMWSNIDNNKPYNKDSNPRGIPDRYIVTDKSILEDSEFAMIKSILARKNSWDSLSNYEKNRIRYDVLQHEGIYDEWAFLPSDVQERTSKKTFNPHLQSRTGGDILAFKHDAYEVLKQYVYTMINKEADAAMKKEAMPLINTYPRGDIVRSVRWYMDKQIKQALGTRTMGAKWLSQEIENLNNLIGKDVIDPNFPNWMAGKLSGQVARGALGPDTAIRNIIQSMQTLVNDGPSAFAKSLHTLITKEGMKGFFKEGSTQDRKIFDILLGAEEYYEGEPVAKTLKGRWNKAEGALGKSGAFYNWVADQALSPMRATEHFNKFLAFESALNEAGQKGLSFEKGVRLGLLRAMEGVPDLIIPDAYWNAFKHTIQSQYGYSKVMRNPLTRGPLAKVSTIFWSYPANTIQFMARGLTDGLKSGDMAKTTRFALYLGFQLTAATALAQLGLDVGSIFGVGLMPVKLFSVPWDIMKGTYNYTFGKTEADRSKGSDDFLNSVGILSIPQFRYGKKIVKTFTDLESGYKAAGTRELEVMETSPLIAMLDLIGMPVAGPRNVYDLVQQMRDQAEDYQKSKQDLVLKGIKALDKGSMADVQEVFKKAKDKNVVLTYSELYKYHRIHKTKTYLESQIERLPKHLRAPMQKRVDELNKFLMPNKFGQIEFKAERPMWSAPPQTESSGEEQ